MIGLSILELGLLIGVVGALGFGAGALTVWVYGVDRPVTRRKEDWQ